MRLSRNIFNEIMHSYPVVPPETGGIIGGINDEITIYFHDNSIDSSNMAIYEPNPSVLNKIIKQWTNEGIEFYGLLHSHPVNEPTLSNDDVSYINKLMLDLPDGSMLYFPIVLPEYKMIPYIAKKTNGNITILQEKLEIYE